MKTGSPDWTNYPVTRIKRASVELRAKMEEVVREENEFQKADYSPMFDDEQGPEFRVLVKGSEEYRIDVYEYEGSDKIKWHEGICRCNRCGGLQIEPDGDEPECVWCGLRTDLMMEKKMERYSRPDLVHEYWQDKFQLPYGV